VLSITTHYFDAFKKKFGKPHIRISDEARALISAYAWPGNVRELVNVLERAVLLCNGDAIEPEHLPIQPSEGNRRTAFVRRSGGRIELELPPGIVTMDDLEQALIEATLKRTRGNVSRAADLLGISRGALRNKIARKGIDTRSFHRPASLVTD